MKQGQRKKINGTQVQTANVRDPDLRG